MWSKAKVWDSFHRALENELTRNMDKQCLVALRTQGAQRAYVHHDINMYSRLISFSNIQHPRP